MNNFEKANELYINKNYLVAIEAYKHCNEYLNDTSEATCLYNIGVCYIKLERYDDAIPYIEKALLIDKKSIYYFNLGYSYTILKQYKEALKYFKTSLKLDPYDKDTKKAIGIIEKTYPELKEVSKITEELIHINQFNIMEKLSILKAEINYALDTGNKELFVQVSGEFNKLNKEYI